RPGPARGLIAGHWGLYGAAFDLLVAPSKPIVGTVRDKRTGKPIPGVIVESVHHSGARTATDARGRYRLLGAAKKGDYAISAGGGKVVPYFDFTRLHIPDTAGLEPIRFDIELERGVEVTGRLTEKGTGRPVRGRVHYVPLPDNPHLKDYSDAFKFLRVLVSDWGRTRADGSFSALTIPGPGLLMVCADEV